MVFTSTYLCVFLCIFIGITSYGHASRFSFGDEGQLVHSLDEINNVGELKLKKTGRKFSGSTYDVTKYGAKGDGIQDDTPAFEAAWTAACANNGIMLVPSSYKFLVQTITFSGAKCPPNMTLQVDGEIVAPMRSAWKEVGFQWILFTELKNGLTVSGSGIIDGSGEEWWNSVKSNKKSVNGHGNKVTSNRPLGIRIERSNHVTVSGITMRNTPQMHLFFFECQDVKILDFVISSPEDSPNTDGIHLARTQNVLIRNATLGCGDDCISIQSGCSTVRIINVHCGPGHGYSIGSLGHDKDEADVYNIEVYDSTATNTLNGVRIKALESATGSARNISFGNIIMSNVANPIIIDQSYCNGRDFCNSGVNVDKSALAISGVTFNNIKGTYTKRPVALVCSKRTPCKDIYMSKIDLNPSKATGVEKNLCANAYGRVLTSTKPTLDDCILSDKGHNVKASTSALASGPGPASASYLASNIGGYRL